MVCQVNAVFENEGRRWVGYVVELAGVQAEGVTLEEARESLRDLIRQKLISNRDTIHHGTQTKRIVREEMRINL